MNSRRLTLVIAVFVLQSFVTRVTSGEPTTPIFAKTLLTKQQSIACAAFKANASKLERRDWDQVQKLGIFSNGKPEKVQFGSGTSYEATFKITPDEVIDLLGKPAGRVDDDLIFYGLGHDGVFIYIMQIVFDHGICVGASVGTSIN